MKNQHIEVDRVIYDVIATVHDDDTNKDFAVYADKNIVLNKDLTISCVLYHEEDGKLIAEKIKEEQDKETAKEIMQMTLKKLYQVAKKK